MIASYVASFIGSFIALPQSGEIVSKQQSLATYTSVFGYIAVSIFIITIIMIMITPILNKYTNRIKVVEDHHADIDNVTYHPE